MIRALSGVVFFATLAACASEAESPPPTDTADRPGLAVAAPATDDPACWLRSGVTQEQAAQRSSPRDSASAPLGSGVVKVCYGAPSARGRTIIGGLDAYGQPWRMGADEATAFHTTVPVTVGGVALAPGTYSLYGIPDPETWTVVFNSRAERWGVPLNAQVRAHDVGQFAVATEATDAPVETLRYRFEAQGEGQVDLVMEFERTRVRIPIRVTE